MKVVFENKRNCSVTLCNEDDGMYDAPTTFEDINAAIAYCDMEIDVRQQAISAVIWDTMTGEIYATCSWNEDDIEEEDYPIWDNNSPYDVEWDDHYWDDDCPIDDVDESNYDPYAGCDIYEVEPFDC